MSSKGQNSKLAYTAVRVQPDGAWRADLPDAATDIVAIVRTRSGRDLTTHAIDANATELITILLQQPAMQYYRKNDGVPQIKGLLTDAQGQPVPYTSIVVYAEAPHLPLLLTTADAEGQFVLELAKKMPEQIIVATLDGKSAIVLTTADLRDGDTLLLRLADEKNTGAKAADNGTGEEDTELNPPCDCHTNNLGLSAAPRGGGAFTYTNSNLFSQDISACEPLSKANRTVEEFKFYKISRTSQPLVRKFAFGKLYNEVEVLKNPTLVQKTEANKILGSAGDILGYAPAIDTPATDIKTVWDPVLRSDGSQIWGIAKVAPGPDWLDCDYGIDWTRGWDAGVWQATLHQAVHFAHGRIFVMRQTMTADGHSKGEVVGSDTLLSGEKRQKVILDWQRQESASRSESVEQTDSLAANISRNRDLSEVVSGVVKENSKGRSDTKGGSDAFGMGVGGYVGFGFAMGMATSSNYQGSSSSQESDRTTAADSLQQLHDSTQQSANSVRAMRSLVVQSVAQSENATAETFVIANHNHCHALSVFYHRVHAHYIVKQELTDVMECLYVPMQMRPFEMDTIVRYREALRSAFLLSKNDPLYRAFDIAFHQYLTSGASGVATTYNSENIHQLRGSLQIKFFLHVPSDKKITVDRSPDPDQLSWGYNDGTWADYEALLAPDYSPESEWGELEFNTPQPTRAANRKRQFLADVYPILVRKIAAKIKISIGADAATLTNIPCKYLVLISLEKKGRILC